MGEMEEPGEMGELSIVDIDVEEGPADHGLEAPPAPEGLELSARSSSSRGAAEPAGPLLQGFISRADIDMEAPGTYHPLDDEWYTYEATNGMKFILPKRYRVKEELGTGSYAAVLSAYDHSSGETIAIKKCDQLFQHPEDGKRVLREIKLLQFFDHPNLVRTRGLLPPRSPQFLDVYILTEFLDMDLKELLLVVGPLDEDSYQSIFYQVACGLNYIHSAEVIHRDLKPDNILLNVKNNQIVAKICDFNLSRQMQRRDMTRDVVSAAYRPPELLLQTKAPYNSAVDMWSLGGILYEMVTAKQLFPGKKPKHTLLRVLSTIPLPPFPELDWLTSESQQFLRRNCPPLRTTLQAKLQGKMATAGVTLAARLLTLDPAKRPTAAEVMRNPWLKKVQNPANEFTANRKFQWPSDRANLSASRLRALFWQEMLGETAPPGLVPPLAVGTSLSFSSPPSPSPHPGRQAPHSLCSPHHVDMVHLGYSLPPTGLPQGHPLLGPPTSARSDPATPPSAKSASVAARIKLDPPAKSAKPRSASQGIHSASAPASPAPLQRSGSTGLRTVRSPVPKAGPAPATPPPASPAPPPPPPPPADLSSGENGISSTSTSTTISSRGDAHPPMPVSPSSSLGSPAQRMNTVLSNSSQSIEAGSQSSTPRRTPLLASPRTASRSRPEAGPALRRGGGRSGSPPLVRHPVPCAASPVPISHWRAQGAYKPAPAHRPVTTPVPLPTTHSAPAPPRRPLLRLVADSHDPRPTGMRSASQPLAKAKPSHSHTTAPAARASSSSSSSASTRQPLPRRSSSQPKYPLRQYTSPAPPPTTACVARSKSKPLEPYTGAPLSRPL